jgi:serine/threonine protein kinase
MALTIYFKVRSYCERKAYLRLENGEGGAVGNAGFAKEFGQVSPHEFQIGPRIGKGSFAEVFKGQWRGTVIAIKKVPAHSLTAEFFEDFEREAALMKDLRHPNVLLYLGKLHFFLNQCLAASRG